MRLTYKKHCHPKLFLTFLFALSLLISAPSLVRIPRALPFLDPVVRAEAPGMIEQLRARGLWLVNADFYAVEKLDHGLCFVWEHSYTSRRGKDPAEFIATCKLQK